MAAAVATQKVVTDQAYKAADKATKATLNLVESSKKKAEPHFQKTRELLVEHVQPQVDKTHSYYKEHMKPHVDKHVVPYAFPLLHKAGVLLNTTWLEVKVLSREAHSRLVESFKASCPETLGRLKTMEHAPGFMVSHVKQSCQEPEKSVNTFLWTVLFIFVFIFRSFVWSQAVGVVMVPIRIIWFVSPLRLFFGKRKQDQSEDEALSDGADTPVAR